MALPNQKRRPLLGSAKPRIAPPVPARHDLAGYREVAQSMGITPMPWQETVAKYITAGTDEAVIFREVCVVAARQNGKTTLTKPIVVQWLKQGKKVLHVAQTRELPRAMFSLIAAELPAELFAKRRGKGGKMQIVWPRFGAGQEEILLANGGSYRIAASTGTGPRGWSVDRILVDELLAMDDHEAMRALEPTITMSEDGGQIVYLSNAGSESSVVLNAVRARADEDPALAYLEWSASSERSADDIVGWAEANPAFGHYASIQRTLEAAYRKHSLAGTLAIFETEHLCRWVKTMRETLVSDWDWIQCKADALAKPLRSSIGVALAPEGNRASVALAWQSGNRIALRLLEHVADDRIDVAALGELVRTHSMRYGAKVAYDPLTDGELVKYVRKGKAESVTGAKYAAASANFALGVSSRRLAWADADPVTDDLTWTARKPDGTEGSYHAVRAKDDRPITASLAAIRAVWLASGPSSPGAPRIR